MSGRALRRGRLPRPLRVVGALVGVVSLTVMSMVIPLGAPPPAAHADTSSGSCPTQGQCTKTLTASGKPIVDGKGKKYSNASVTVSQTENIQSRQVIHVSWTGFQPSDNLGIADPNGADNPYREGDTNSINYPVALVECWGPDTAEKPMYPTHCQGPISKWPGGHKLLLNSGGFYYAMTNDVSGTHGGVPNPTDVTQSNVRYPPDILPPDTLGFTAVDGIHYKMNPDQKGTDGVPPSLQFSSDALPANSVVSTTPTSGSRTNVEFEVRGGSDLPVLGCSYRQECTLVVIPMVRPGCDPKLYKGPARLREFYGYYCTREPFTGGAQASNGFVNADAWWLGWHWKNRFSFPLHMAPTSGECPVVDQRPTVTVQGSEAATVFMRSWNPHFCLDPRSTFKLTHSNIPEETARTSLRRGGAKAVFTSLPVTGSPQPVVHAPVAVTGWTVGYAIDQCVVSGCNDRSHRGRYTDMTLSPLLLAKFMTESYSYGGGKEPALAGNQIELFGDPEFKLLNPGFDPGLVAPGGGHHTGVIWAVNDSDAFAAMFAYVDADPEARAWLDGKPDSYSGMVVNPAYRGLSAPQLSFQLRDSWVRPNDGSDLSGCQPLPWYEQISQITSTLETATLAVLNRKPQYQECKPIYDPQDEKKLLGWLWGANTKSQDIGKRNIIAFTTVPLAERYGLSMAKLQSSTPNARSVGPAGWEGSPTGASTSFDTLAAALGYTKSDKDTGIVSPDFANFPYNGAYPGVMPVYAAIPTCGLDPTLAGQYADFLTFAADAGQTPGTLWGNLPPGYTPLPKAYADYTRTAAQAVRDQTCTVPPPPNDPAGSVRDQLGLPAPGSDGSGLPSGGGTGSPAKAGNTTPGAGTTLGSEPGAGAAPSSAAHRPATVAATRGSDSWLAGWGLAILLGVGLLAGVAVPLVQIAAQPGHPVRRFFASTTDQAGARLRRTHRKSP